LRRLRFGSCMTALSVNCVKTGRKDSERDLSPEPGQNVGREDCESSAGSDAGQSSFRARLAVGKMIATNYDCGQTPNLSDHAGEEGLQICKASIQRCSLCMSCE